MTQMETLLEQERDNVVDLDIHRIISLTNQDLPIGQHISPDDPIVTLLKANDDMLKAQRVIINKNNAEFTERVEQCVKNTVLEINTLLDQERKTTKDLIQGIFKESGDEIRQKAKLGLQDWEAGFHNQVDATLHCIQATLYVFIFMCFLASIWFIIQIGNWMITSQP